MGELTSGDGVGSSPHTRGAPRRRRTARRCGRDHPRIRGEHSPRHVGRWRGCGIIPAYAGSTVEEVAAATPSMGSSPHTRGAQILSVKERRSPADHPRIRGEHRPRPGRGGARHGIIPAYAGSTLVYLRSQFQAWQFCITSSKATGLVPLACIAPA